IDIAKELNKSERTVQLKIKKLGYKWHSSKKIYEPILEGYDKENDNKNFLELFDNSAIKQLTKPIVEKEKVQKENRNNSTVKKTKDSELDMIDVILNKENHERIQRAYYIDADLAGIIDKVDGKQKSNLINECIRKVFKEKGIL
ncbi:hypothetical protein ACWCXX_40080, partial [Streptomyces sp. NPDC001732]